MSEYDVVIIGGGPGGYNAAIRAGQLGLKVACIEGANTLGGTCLNVGCIPSKALHASELYAAAIGPEFARLRIEASPTLNLAQMMRQKDDSVAALTKGVEFLFRKNKAEWIKGWGHLAGHGRVIVSAHDGSESEVKAANIVIATGSKPVSLPSIDIDNKRILDSTGALSLPEVPKRLVVIGAGVIGVELGSVWRRLGSEVTVVEYLDRICPGVDEEAANALQRALTKQGINFRLQSKVVQADLGAEGVQLAVERAAGGDAMLLQADYVLVAIGRRPHTEGLGLENVGIAPDARGVLTNNRHRAKVESLWVIGDVTSGPMLAHKAEQEAIACIELIAGQAGEVNYDVIPNVIYTKPELATVGKSEEELKKAGIAYKVG
ncbi:MAG: dihydrolipoyl dehydrogenase family protein, partial [Gammaproteobacteria bacterium]